MTFFAIKVKAGKELQAQEMISKKVHNADCATKELVAEIYTLQTCACYVQHESNEIRSEEQVNQDDVYNKMVVDSITNSLSNLRTQYNQLKNKTDEQSKEQMSSIKHEIGQLEKEAQKYKTESRKMDPLLPGYVLIKINKELDFMPAKLWNLIRDCDFVTSIPSRYSIPNHELDSLFSRKKEEMTITISFEEMKDNREIDIYEKDLLHEANTAQSLSERQELLQKLDEPNESVYQSVYEIKQATESNSIQRIKTFIKSKRQFVTMPIFLFFEMYHEFEDKHLLPVIRSNDFLYRLHRLLRSKRGIKMLE